MNRSRSLNSLLDNALRLLSVSGTDAELNQLADRVLSAPVTLVPSAQREQQVVARLTAQFQPTLGRVLQTAISQQQTDVAQLAQEIKLPTDLLTKLLGDALFISNIPVVRMRDLLRRLAVPFEAAQSAISQTVHVLRQRAADQEDAHSPSLAFRRDGTEGSLATNRQEGQLLFENDDALTMYLQRLEDLMQS